MPRSRFVATTVFIALGIAAALVWHFFFRGPGLAFVIMRDIEFANVNGKPLLLDLYLPTDRDPAPPVIIWLHGGAWKWGDKNHNGLRWLASEGYASVTVNYRLSGEAPFPAAIQDCKAVVRWVRGNAKKYGLDGERIVAAGSSAGGHLAALLGTSDGVTALEGDVGEHDDQSSRVRAVIAFCAPMDLTGYLNDEKSTLHREVVELLGPDAEKRGELAGLASPATHLDASDPPVLLIHGDADETVALAESEQFLAACRKAGVKVELIRVPGGEHDDGKLYDDERKKIIRAFLRESLR